MRIRRPTRTLSSISQIYLLLYSPKPLTKYLPKVSHKTSFFSHLPFHSSLCSTMAGGSESFSTTAEDTAKYGFERGDMYQSNLAGTLDPYERHVFLCYKSHESWPTRVEDSDSDPLPKLLASAIKARKGDMNLKTKLTICEGSNDLKLSDGDVLIFPDMILYRGLKESDVDSFVEDVLVSGKPWLSGVQEELTG
ncbi:hypothetical protein CDL12_30257 [Handroanthus impetiginosus]|uniref:Uncharacterized protein n=1 Tax=Handroanthus impetiginosus TaxID=429701 RepID=A0A2G9FW36_9LAMI|nr:hypothetical protein CDL12_30257 [Handroanthus impetiginosus]